MTGLEQYLRDLPEGRRDQVARVHALVRAAVPELAPCTAADGSPAYGPYSYRYASGRSGRSALVQVTPTSTGVSVHVRAVLPDGRYVAEAAAAQLRPATVGRSCVRYRLSDPVDAEALVPVLRRAVEQGPASGTLDPARQGRTAAAQRGAGAAVRQRRGVRPRSAG